MSGSQVKKTQPLLINGYQIDTFISEAHEFDSDLTEYPVETGGDVTDNIRPKAIMVTIEGIVSDTPLGAIADLRNGQGDNGQLDFLPSQDALAVLLAIRDAREPVSITTTLKHYDNMVLATLTVPVDAKTGAALRFTAVFQQVIFVTNNRTTVRTATPSNGAQRNLGNKNTKILDAKKMIWKKGTPPGAPLGPTYQIEQIFIGDVNQVGPNSQTIRQRYFHSDGTTELTPAELSAANLDFARDLRSKVEAGMFTGHYTYTRLPDGAI